MTRLVLEELVEDDLEALRPATLALSAHHHDVAPELGAPREPDEHWERVVARLGEERAKGGRIVVARAEGRVVGFASGHPADVSPTFDEEGAPWIVTVLSVLAPARGAGLGARLLDAFERTVEATELRLLVLEANEPARRFYEREGFSLRTLELSRPARRSPPKR